MRPRLAEYLICPECKDQFAVDARERDGSGEVLEGLLRCRGCSCSFPIVRGIPRLGPSSLDKAVRDTTAAFGWQWQKFDASLQQTLFDSSQLFLDFIAPVQETFFQGKVVLDAGCGRGRFTRQAQALGAREVIGIDLSDSVEVAYRNTRDLPNVHIVQADIYNLPFPAVFDYVFSVGVLHHLPNPREGFRCLPRHLKEGGSISIWVYGREHNAWLLTIVDPLRRYITSRIPSQGLNILTHIVMIGLYPALKSLYRPVTNGQNGKKPRTTFLKNDYFAFLAQFDYSTVRAVVFDHLTPSIAHYLTREELLEWFNSAEWKEVVVTPRTRNSWRGFASKSCGALAGLPVGG